ncbi:MAG: Crp/Fnr family transcriptional regulator [Phaeodactylibacter sp.]|uniref:Crp/Fnr family transcriptional regulator n=1 Tax=Phaeodactylibacter sp. TaxID=1940289 RepID=UPI0032EF55B5
MQFFYDQLELHQAWDEQLTIERNDCLIAEGQTDDRLYYIESGSLRVYWIHGDEEHTIRFGYPESFIGALDSFLNGQPSVYYLQAIRQSRLKAMRKSTFLALREAVPEMAELYSVLLEQLVLQQLEREQDLLIASPLERYQRVLQRSPQLFQEIPHKYIASYLRMTPETLSRIKKS